MDPALLGQALGFLEDLLARVNETLSGKKLVVRSLISARAGRIFFFRFRKTAGHAHPPGQKISVLWM
jgi:hypothetical protein